MASEQNIDLYENVSDASGDIFQRLENEIQYLPKCKAQVKDNF